MKKLYISTFFLVLASCLLMAQQDTTKYGVAVPEKFTCLFDVVYDKTDNWEGKMDVYLPPNEGKPIPIAINIHGGGWARNSKEKEKGFHSFFRNKIAIANMSYRLTGTATAPAAVEDVRSVLTYLVKHAKELNIDTEKIIIMGTSAGGHLSMMGGYLNTNLYDKDKQALKDLKIAAVINKCGVADMVDFSVGSMNYKSAVRWLGTVTDTAFIRTVSPMTYIDKNTPPTFIVHGDADEVVPYSQSVVLYKALKDNGVMCDFFTVEGGKHGGNDSKTKMEINRRTMKFLKGLDLIE